MRSFSPIVLGVLTLISLPLVIANAVPRAATTQLAAQHGCNAGTGPGTSTGCECPAGLYSTQGVCKCHDGAAVKVVIQYLHGGYKESVTCDCPGKHQTYLISANSGATCVCDAGYTATFNKKGKLQCTVNGQPPPSKRASIEHKRSFDEAIDVRESGVESRELEDLMGCEINEKACKMDRHWACKDMWFDLNACGGCKGEALDCAALPGVNEVRCSKGHCIVDSCHHGYTLETPLSANSTSVSALCIPKRKEGNWLFLQGGSEEM
ncbi:hypothetical protein M231_07627 [Tremella mesenterica]|uniref:Protein CPL1-like domain-containing protein n=1 Tax=Tremella mesenterica TaxID=5217 RepID=A0A4V1M2Z7_TREME|nr:hypothetical protein M231_07627 [Tremella mesenterica]